MKRITFRSYRTATFFLILISILIPLMVTTIITVSTANVKTERLLEENLLRYAEDTRIAFDENIHQIFKAGLLVPKKPETAAEAGELLNNIIAAYDIDLAAVVDSEGRAVARALNNRTGDTMLLNGLVNRTLAGKIAMVSTEIIPADELARENEKLLAQTATKRIPSISQQPDRIVYEKDGMAQLAVIPFEDGGALILGDVLNRDYRIPDSIGTIKGVEVSIFQGDYRISTTIKTQKGNRQVGTVLSENIVNKTLVRGETFIGKIGNWGRATYSPIRNHRGEIIGAIGIEIPEESFMNSEFFLKEKDFVNLIIIVAVVVAGFSFIIAFVLSKKIVKPINEFTRSAQKVVEGNLDQGVNIESYDEFNRLAKTFNIMIRSVRKLMQDKKRR